MACGESGNVDRNRSVEIDKFGDRYLTGGLSVVVSYGGDPASCNPIRLKQLEEYAESAIDVYNKTHLKKYSFVKLLFATLTSYAGAVSDIMFTVKPEPEEEEEDAVDKKTLTFRAKVSVTGHYVEDVEFYPGDDWKSFYMQSEFWIKKPKKNSTENIRTKKSLDCSVLYDGDPTHCDEKSMNILRECAEFAIEVYNKIHEIKYNLLDMVNASGDLSTDSMVDLMFTAMAMHQTHKDDKYPKNFTTRVSITHNYVEFVELYIL
ncbi:hypothetical protein ABFS83_06G043400 [Erythranthe nasuta]